MIEKVHFAARLNRYVVYLQVLAHDGDAVLGH